MSQIVVIKRQKLFAETDAAILIGNEYLPQRGKEGKSWVPSSLVVAPFPFNDLGDVADVELPKWFAEQAELEYEET